MKPVGSVGRHFIPSVLYEAGQWDGCAPCLLEKNDRFIVGHQGYCRE